MTFSEMYGEELLTPDDDIFIDSLFEWSDDLEVGDDYE